MATSKKNAKGSKTAHVLNLLTAPDAPKEGAPAGEEPAAELAADQAAPAANSRPLLPPILEVAQSNDENLAQQIQQALEEELEDMPETGPAAPPPAQSAQSVAEEVSPVTTELPITEQVPVTEPVPAPDPAPDPAPTPEPVTAASAPSGGEMSQDENEELLADTPAKEPEPASAPEQELAPASQPAAAPAPEPEPAPVQEPAPQPQPPEEEDVTYMNVMQVLVEEKAPRYIQKFGLCTCKHCEADVKALTLSNLVPKYVVLSKMDRIPMLTVYEGRFSTTIFAQLTRACKIVMDHPHHSREE